MSQYLKSPPLVILVAIRKSLWTLYVRPCVGVLYIRLGQPESWRLTLEVSWWNLYLEKFKNLPKVRLLLSELSSSSVLVFSKVCVHASCMRTENRRERQKPDYYVCPFCIPLPLYSTNLSETLYWTTQLLKVRRKTQKPVVPLYRFAKFIFISNPNSQVLFSIAAVTNYSKLSGLKPHKFIVHLCRSEVWSRSQQAEIKVLEECIPFLEVLGENPFPLPFPASRGHPLSLPHGPFHHLQS